MIGSVLSRGLLLCVLLWSLCPGMGMGVGPLPKSLTVPRQFVGVFAEGERVVVYGDLSLMNERYSPCSTFKIVSTLVGLAEGVVENLESRLGYDGSQYEYDFWEGDLTLQRAFQVSCVPYFTKLMNHLRKETVCRHVEELEYGNGDLSAWSSAGHQIFWIGSSLKISAREQIEVLQRILEGRSRYTRDQVRLLKACMKAGTWRGFRAFGKTGAGRNPVTKRLEGWYVGFAEMSGGRRIYFALHGADSGRDVSGAEMRETARRLLEHWRD